MFTFSTSVLICTYNRHDMLRLALDTLLLRSNELPNEVVIVNGGDERADQVIAEFVGRTSVPLRLIKTINRNLATSRNIGLAQCRGEIVCMTDDDAEVFPDWLTQMKSLHAEHPEAGAVGGPVIGADSHESFISRLADLVTFPTPRQAGYVRTLAGVNISYKRAALEKIGLQDETLFRGEDVDFNWRLLQAGYKVYFDPAVRVLHHHRPTLRRFLNQHYMYGRAYYLVRRKWPEMYSVYPHRFRRLRDILKALNFVAAAFYQPFFYARRLSNWADRVRAVPILMLNQFLWRGGMMYQKWLTERKSAA